MNTKFDTVCCTLEMGEIFPGAVLKEEISAEEQAGKESKADFIRSSRQEMLDNYNSTH